MPSRSTMLAFLAPALLLLPGALAAPAPASNAAAATVGQIRGVQSPIFHLYLQANPKNGVSLALGRGAS